MFATGKKKYKKTNVDPLTLEHSDSLDSGGGRLPKVSSPGRYKKTHKSPPIPLEGSKSSEGVEGEKGAVRERKSEPVSAAANAKTKADNVVQKSSSLPIDYASSTRTTASMTKELKVLRTSEQPVAAVEGTNTTNTTSSDPTELEPPATVHTARGSTAMISLVPQQEVDVGNASGQSGAQEAEGGGDKSPPNGGNGQWQPHSLPRKPKSGAKGDEVTAESEGGGDRVVVLSPLLSFLLQDWSILFLLSILSTAMTYVHLDEITADGGGVPLKVAALWVAFAWLLGSLRSSRRQALVVEQHLSEVKRLRADIIAAKKRAEEEQMLDEAVQRTSAKMGAASPVELSTFRKRHTLLCRAMASARVLPTVASAAPKQDDFILPEGFSCELRNEPKGEIELADFLMNRLVKVPTHRLSADKKCAIPICPQRGMDIFLTDSPDDWLCENKLLLRCGLRAKPTMIINLVMPWANIGVFFELPPWVKKFSDISVADSDRDDIKTFKNFLKGDDEYKKFRLQFLPCLRDGPMAMRILAPKKKEIIGRATMLSHLSWRQHDETTDRFGRKKCAVLEGSLDVTSDAVSRSVGSVMRRYLPSLVMDVAFVIDQPELQEEYEPSAVLGFMNLHKIDVATCPVMPQKSEEEMMEVARASVAAR